ncbi:MAG: RnfABCDGE type electron transport complex subunit B [Candidatus Omnitrophica bacterium]|nr:RnfABCDGE type electron transport complex subunit B [Candidatus Omnitrophota bacterium]HOX54791.1 RnfABCDGE type electron transport complex subunit B [Candidatus Omnitrophota bacterium]
MMEILIPVLTLASLGMIFGVGLAIAAKKLCVEQDPKISAVFSHLPGANCGACGMAGCMGFAEGLINGTCTVERCVVASEKIRTEISKILGVEAKAKIKTAAVLHCNGGNKVKDKFQYQGIKDCVAANQLQGGQKACVWGCLGFGSCAKVCPFSAITMSQETGLPVVDESKCTACGNCVKICPKHLFTLIDVKKPVYIACSSHDKGKAVMDVCKVGCIACLKCEKQCAPGLFKVKDNLSQIDYNSYVPCDDCIKVCPTSTIRKRGA